MIEKNPEESVLDEQSGAKDNAFGTEETTNAEKAIDADSPGEAAETEKSPEKNKVKEKKRPARVRVASPEKVEVNVTENQDQESDTAPDPEQILDDIVLPPVRLAAS